MPFASPRQRRFLYARHPEIAAKWAAEGKAGVDGKSRAPSRGKTSRRKGFLSRMAEGYRG